MNLGQTVLETVDKEMLKSHWSKGDIVTSLQRVPN